MDEAERAGSTARRGTGPTISEDQVSAIFRANGVDAAGIKPELITWFARTLSWHPGASYPDPIDGPDWQAGRRVASLGTELIALLMSLVAETKEAEDWHYIVPNIRPEVRAQVPPLVDALGAFMQNDFVQLAPAAALPRRDRLRYFVEIQVERGLRESGAQVGAGVKRKIAHELLQLSEGRFEQEALRKSIDRFNRRLEKGDPLVRRRAEGGGRRRGKS